MSPHLRQAIRLFATFAACGAFAQSQPRLIIPVELKNGCTIDIPAGPATPSYARSVEDIYPFTCPASGRYTGSAAVGLMWRERWHAPNSPTGAELRERNGVWRGWVIDGVFDGVRMVLHENGTMVLAWTDTGGNSQFKRFNKSDAGYSLQATKKALADAIRSSASKNKQDNLLALEAPLIYWNDDPMGEVRRFHKEPYSAEFRNPTVSADFGRGDPVIKEDPPARGRSARGG